MRHSFLTGLLSTGLALLTLCGSAAAQTPLLHFPMESVEDGEAKLYTKDSGSAVAVPGKIGKALRFDGQAVLALPFNLDHADYPQVTVTAWVKQEDGASGSRTIFHSGSTAGLSMAINGGRLAMRTGGPGVMYSGGKVPYGEWVFIAAVLDTSAGIARLYQSDGAPTVKDGLDITTKAPRTVLDSEDPEAGMKPYVFVGGNDIKTFYGTSRDLAIDDVRVYAGALSPDRIDAIRRGAGNTGRTASQIPDGIANPDIGRLRNAPDLGRDGKPGAARTAETIGETEKNDAGEEESASLPKRPGRTVEQLPGDIKNPGIGAPSQAPELEPTGGRSVGQLPDEIENPDVSRLPTGAPHLQYDSPEAAEEAARQREEAAHQRAEAEKAQDQQQGLEGIRIRPIGDPRLSSLSGINGGIQRPIDLQTEFLREIEWDQVNAKPCMLWVESQPPEGPSVRLAWGPKCGVATDGVFYKTSRSVRLYPQLITSIAVCSSNKNRMRLKGIKIGGSSVGKDGKLSTIKASDQESYTNCGHFSYPKQCPDNMAATGLVVFSKEGVDDQEILTGLQLICRKIAID